ncbi:MAG TPA: hypothetical protein VFX53_04635 [Pedococcus sp.]|nr:hypothetical protein [Pedococcus sp.]
MDRNYAAEIAALIGEATAETPYDARQVAGTIVARLRDADPDLLAAWLDVQAEDVVYQALVRRERSQRSYVAQRERRGAFRGAIQAAEAGDRAPLRTFMDTPYTVGDNIRKRLADLTAADLEYVAETYEQRSITNALTAAFLKALAKNLGQATVGEAFTEDQVARMWRAQQMPYGAPM